MKIDESGRPVSRLPSTKMFAGLKVGAVVIAWRPTYDAYMTCRVLNWGVMRNGKPFVSLSPFQGDKVWVSSFVSHPRRLSALAGFTPTQGPLYPGTVLEATQPCLSQ
jgi:hypothetical protein